MAGTTNIQDPPDKIKKVYDAVSAKFDVGSYDQFKKDMRDPAKNRKVYDVVSKDFDVGSYNTFQQDISGSKKKDSAGSHSPSDSSPKPDQTGQPIDTSGSKALSNNFKNNSVTSVDVIDKSSSHIGPTPEQVSSAINNKGKNIDKAKNAPSNFSTQFLIKEKSDVQKEKAQLESQTMSEFEYSEDQVQAHRDKINRLSDREEYLTNEIGKSYNFAKKSLVPELVNEAKSIIKDEDFNPETHQLSSKVVERVAGIVDGIMNKKKDNVVNAAVSGDLDDKKRTYADLTKSVIDQLNVIPIQKAQHEFTKEFAKGNPEIEKALKANEEVHDYFSESNFDDIKAKIKVDADKSFISTQDKYYGNGGIFPKNQDYVGIQHKYAQLVAEKKMPEDVAKKQMDAEIAQNPALKKIKSAYDTEIRKTIENTQKQYEQYVIGGLQKKHPEYTIYKDGTIGLSSLSEDQYTNMMEGYQEGMDAIAKKMGAETNEAWKKYANSAATRVGPFWGSLGASTNALLSGLTKMVFNKTGWGGEKVRHFEAQEIASPNLSQSDVAATWNWKGIESLTNPNFYLSNLGASVPVIAGAGGVSLATEGAGLPEYIGWLSSAGLFTAQTSLSTYDQLLSTKDANGNMLSEADAARGAADQAKADFLPNVLMMALGSGTLSRAKNIAKPTVLGTIGKGIRGAAEAQPFFTWQGYNDYSTMLQAQGKNPDIYDYLQSKEFRDNLVNGMIIGSGISMLHAPFNYMKSMDNWTKMVHTSEGEFKNLIPQNYALGQEMAGNGNYLRDALKLHVFNIDPEGLNEEGKRNLADLKNTLLYSVNLDKNIRTGNLDPKNINDLYQAHNLALADQHDFLSDQAKDQGNKTLSDVYKDKAKDYREQAKAAANDQAKYHYLVNDDGHPIFISDKAFKTLGKEGTIAKWMEDGTIKAVHDNSDPEFAHRYKDFVTAKSEATVEGKDIMEHGADLIEQNKDKLGTYYAVAKENPEMFYKEVADQIHGVNADGSTSLRPDAEIAARQQFGDNIVDLAKTLYPITEKEGGQNVTQEGQGQVGESDQPAGEQEHTRTGAPRDEEKKPRTDSGDSGKDGQGQEVAPKVGDEVQWTSQGAEQFPEPKKIVSISDDGKYAFVEGSDTGIPVDQLTISSPKTEDHGKAEETHEAQGGQKGDVLEPKEGEGKPKEPTSSSSKPTSVVDGPPPTESTPSVKESPKEEFTAIYKRRQEEINGAKELFDKQKVIPWSETYNSGLHNVQAMFPDKPLYEAMRSRVNEFTTKLDNGILYNPTSEDIAVFNVFKDITKRKIGEIVGWDSTDDVMRAVALAEFSSLHNDLFNVVRVNNPGGEAGRAFNLLQSEIAFDPEHGLQIRRMELLGAKAGEKLTPEELAWSADQWEKERSLIGQQHEAELRQQQEKFEKEIDRLKKLQGKPERVTRERGQKIANGLRSFADKLEKVGKADLPEGTQRMGVDLQKNVADAIRWIADKIESGDIRIPDLVFAAIDKFKGKESEEDIKKGIHDGFKDAGVDEGILKKPTSRQEALKKIRESAQASGATAITNDMVAKNFIRDYVKSHIGLEETKDVVGAVTKGLKPVLPDIDENMVRKAYLKEGEYRQPAKKELENSVKEATRNFDKLAKTEKDINDLNEKQDLYKRTNKKAETPYDKEILAKEKEKKDLMTSLGVKTGGQDKYAKASYDQRATSHNDRIDELNKKIEEKISSGDLSDDHKKALLNLKGKLDAAKAKLDPNSKISQEKVLDAAISVFKGIHSEFNRASEKDITKLGDIRRGLQKIADGFNSDKEASEQDIKFQRTKDRLKQQSTEYQRKINAEEFEDNPVTILTKSDAELIRLQSEMAAQTQVYAKKKSELERKTRSNWKRLAEVARGVEVTVLIGSPFTLMKVAGSALLRPQLEAATKLTVGKGFELLPFQTTKAIVERAKRGGESLSLKSIEKGYEAYFRQYSEKQLADKYIKANDVYEKADHEYEVANGKVSDKELQVLKNKRDSALLDAVGNVVYQYIAGSSLREAGEALLHRTVKIERMFGQIDADEWAKGMKSAKGKEKFDIAMQNFSYVMNFVGRSHAALKNFSARQSFAAGFMARLEGAVRDGVDVTSPDRLLEMANESYIDFERGKYQQANWISDKWNAATRAVEREFPQLAYLMKADIAIVRVPVNMLHEGIMEYTLGAFTGSWNAWKEYSKAKGLVLQDGFTESDQKEFKKALGEQLGRIDPDKAATILRCFRKGGFGLGLYGLSVFLAHAAFGGFAHKGQTAEDKKKKKYEDEFGTPIIKTGEIKIGDWKMPDAAAKIVEHTPAFQPMLFGLGLAQVYENNIKAGKSTVESAKNDAEAHILHIVNSIPQMDLIDYLAGSAIDKLNVKKRLGEWQDVDQNGNPVTRKAYNANDYLLGNRLLGGDPKNILSDAYYKQAVKTNTYYQNAISEIEYNPNLSKQAKEDQRQDLLKQRENDIDEIYRQNKENPQ